MGCNNGLSLIHFCEERARYQLIIVSIIYCFKRLKALNFLLMKTEWKLSSNLSILKVCSHICANVVSFSKSFILKDHKFFSFNIDSQFGRSFFIGSFICFITLNKFLYLSLSVEPFSKSKALKRNWFLNLNINSQINEKNNELFGVK